MLQEEIELYAFLYFCGARDRRLLMGKEVMSFSDFSRLHYIADCLQLECFSLKFWNQYISQFEKDIQRFEHLADLEDDEIDGIVLEDEFLLSEAWLLEFCNNAPNKEARSYLKDLMKISE